MIHKSGGIIIRDRKLLVTRSWNETFFIAPGGKLEEGETAKQALVRELKEELGIAVEERDLKEFGTFSGKAASDETKTIQMEVYIVKSW
ncbi:MAG: NUDIX domain-containing protein [bacterium]|nr:NUDIX domain-containing protein [bacterium]